MAHFSLKIVTLDGLGTPEHPHHPRVKAALV
jgi:hypothetical protein